MINRLRDEAGYSLVEVMVSILILSIAIIPMVSMFDTGLKTAVLGGNYDTARALAKKQLESVQSLPYKTVKVRFPSSPAPFNISGRSVTTGRTDPEPLFSGFTYDIEKQFVSALPPGSDTFVDSPVDVGLMRVTVTVRWESKTYNATTIKVR